MPHCYSRVGWREAEPVHSAPIHYDPSELFTPLGREPLYAFDREAEDGDPDGHERGERPVWLITPEKLTAWFALVAAAWAVAIFGGHLILAALS